MWKAFLDMIQGRFFCLMIFQVPFQYLHNEMQFLHIPHEFLYISATIR